MTRRLRARWPAMPVWCCLLSLLAGLAGAVIVAGPAAAHNFLLSTSPADHSTVARTPAVVVLTFDEPSLAIGTQIVVSGAAGQVQQGPPRLVDNTVSQDLEPDAPAGTYTVAWRVTSSDGHPISGQFRFTSTAAGSPRPGSSTTGATPAGPAGNADSRTLPSWAWVVGGLLLVTTAGAVGWSARRRSGRGYAQAGATRGHRP
jgi:methionine-rich copper-binding protein CopC